MAKRLLERDLGAARQTMEEIHDNTEDLVARSKRARTFQDADEIPDVFTAVQGLFIDLRAHNRGVRSRARNELSRQKKIQDSLQALDHDIQNLKYERNHFKREIQSSRTLPSEVAKVELIPEAQFRSTAPVELQPRGVEADPEHALLLNRLQFELQQRKELQEAVRDLRERERAFVTDTEEKTAFLGAVRSQLSKLAYTAKSMKSIFGIKPAEDLEARDVAMALPRPLFFFFRQFSAFKEARQLETASLEIVGDVAEAKRFNATTPIIDRYESHPLHLRLAFPLKDVLDLEFEIYYLPALALTTIRSPSARGEDVLTALYEGDHGDSSPNPALAYLCGSDFTFDKAQRGRPFRWLQALCGVNFLPPDQVYASLTAVERTTSQRSVESARDLDDGSSSSSGAGKQGLTPSQLYSVDVHAVPDLDSFVSRLKLRAVAVKALAEQLEALAKHKIPADIKTRLPIRSLCTFVGWVSIDSNTYHNRKASAPLTMSTEKKSKRKERDRIEDLGAKHKEKEHSKLLEMALPDAPDDGKEEGEILEEAALAAGQDKANNATAEEGEVLAEAPRVAQEEGEVDAMDIDSPPIAPKSDAPLPSVAAPVAVAPADSALVMAKEAAVVESEPAKDQNDDMPMPDAEPEDNAEGEPKPDDEEGEVKAASSEVAETLQSLSQHEVDHDRYFRATFKLGDKLIDELKILVRIPVQYPQVLPEIRFAPRVYTSSPLAHLDSATRRLCDPKATMLASQTSHYKTLDVNFEQILSQVNDHADSFVKSQDDRLNAVSLQLRKVKMCLDMLLEINKKGQESNIVKILGRAFTGRERILNFDQVNW